MTQLLDTPPNVVGRRLREIRRWRGKSLQVVADLAGISYGYLGKLERGEKELSNRGVLEGLAMALEVAPTEFTGLPWETPGGPGEKAHAGVVAVEAALESYDLGHDPGVQTRDWAEVAHDLKTLADLAQAADYARQGELTPRLLGELHALHVRRPDLRSVTLPALIRCYSSAMWITKRLGSRGLPLVAAKAAQQCAEELEAPAWLGFTTWLRGDATGALSRPQQYDRAVRMADQLTADLDDPDTVQAFGMLHLSASLAAAVQRQRDVADMHLREAADVANRMDVEVGHFGRMWFGRANVGIWRATIGLEFGDGPKVVEQARTVAVDAIPSASRQAEFFSEVGRALLGDPKRRDDGLKLVLKAEKLSPQRIRADVFVREAVAGHLRQARRDAGGRELRGLAYRMGIAPEFSPDQVI